MAALAKTRGIEVFVNFPLGMAIQRFLRPVCYQDLPDGLLPDDVKQSNPLGLDRLVNGETVLAA